MKKSAGFTLVEVLIVVVILGILAAVVIPQFSAAGIQARESSLRFDLQTMRSQLELFKIQHDNKLPSTESMESFMADMRAVSEEGFGPYIQKMPINPFINAATSKADGIMFERDRMASCPGDGSAGWWLNTVTGEFRANDVGVSMDGIVHKEL